MQNSIEEIKLSNGLKIYLYLDKSKHTTFFNLVTKFGGLTKDFIIDGKEYHINDGIAHLLEHYVVENSSFGSYIDILGQKHMNVNATTSVKFTSYYLETAVNLEYGINTLLNCCYNPIFNQKKLDKIRPPIYQEIRMRHDDIFYELFLKKNNSLFHNISFKDIGGDIENLKKVDINTLKIIYEAFYQPSNQFIIIAGNFKKNKLLKIIKDFYKKQQLKKHTIKLIDVKEPEMVKHKQGTVRVDTKEEYANICYKINIDNFNNIEQLKLDYYLPMYLEMSFGLTSKLYQELVNEKIISYAFDTSFSTIHTYLLITIGCYSSNTKELINRIKKKIVCLDSFDEETFKLLKKRYKMNISISKEKLGKIINPLLENIIEYNYPHLDTVNDVDNLKFEEFIKIIKDLDFSNYTISYMKRKYKKDR